MQTYGAAVVLASRFLAGLRITIPVVCGVLRMPPVKYSLLNFISALLWASLYSILAYHFWRTLGGRILGLPSGWLCALGILLVGLYICLRMQARRKQTLPG
ncbi:MAG: VTT domain-containing protein [Acidobacteria bacterium]|nr:VTT domain-containing protein [Acidobacteriota bacterium]